MPPGLSWIAADVATVNKLAYTIWARRFSHLGCAHFRAGQVVMAANRILEFGSRMRSEERLGARADEHTSHAQKQVRTTKTTICFEARVARAKRCGYEELWRIVRNGLEGSCCLLLRSLCSPWSRRRRPSAQSLRRFLCTYGCRELRELDYHPKRNGNSWENWYMAATLLGKCPGCKKVVRLPEDWATRTVRCKSCGMVCQSRPTKALQARQAAARTPVAAAAPADGSIPVVAAVTVDEEVNGQITATPPQDPGAWSAITQASHLDPTIVAATPRYQRKKRGWGIVVAALAFLAVCLVGSTAIILVIAPKIKERMNAQVGATSQKERSP